MTLRLDLAQHKRQSSSNAARNRIMPFHPGAPRFYTEADIKLAPP
jgi:TRAP-type uncharacterized transport system substrate-binding protein